MITSLSRGARLSQLQSKPITPSFHNGQTATSVTFAIKPVYSMVHREGVEENLGQPLSKIKVASIPNGILLTSDPNYLSKYPHLFFPGKDDSKKDLRKLRASFSFDILEEIDSWRVTQVQV